MARATNRRGEFKGKRSLPPRRRPPRPRAKQIKFNREELLSSAIKRYGEDDPTVRMLIELHLDIVSGKVHRYVDARLRAADRLLDRLVGRARERTPSGGDFSDVDRVLAHLVDGDDEPDPKP